MGYLDWPSAPLVAQLGGCGFDSPWKPGVRGLGIALFFVFSRPILRWQILMQILSVQTQCMFRGIIFFIKATTAGTSNSRAGDL